MHRCSLRASAYIDLSYNLERCDCTWFGEILQAKAHNLAVGTHERRYAVHGKRQHMILTHERLCHLVRRNKLQAGALDFTTGTRERHHMYIENGNIWSQLMKNY